MTVQDIAIFAVAYLVAGSITAAAAYVAYRGEDLRIFAQLKTTDPKRHHRLRRVALINGPLVALMCLGFLVGSPWIAMHPEGGILLVLASLPFFVIFLWLSIRWFLWSMTAR